MALGSARPLQATDLWRMDDARSAGKLSDDLIMYFEKRQVAAREYNERLADPSTPLPLKQRIRLAFGKNRAEREKEYREKTGKKQASLAWALSDTFGRYFWLGGPIKVLGDLAGAFTPLLIREIIKWSAKWQVAKDRGLPRPDVGHAVGMAIGLFLLLVTASLTIHHFFLRESRCTVSETLLISRKRRHWCPTSFGDHLGSLQAGSSIHSKDTRPDS
jgi:hypothetical protein